MSSGGQGQGGMGFQGYGDGPNGRNAFTYGNPQAGSQMGMSTGQAYGGLNNRYGSIPPPRQDQTYGVQGPQPYTGGGNDQFSDPGATPRAAGDPQSVMKPMALGQSSPQGMNAASDAVAGFRVPGGYAPPGQGLLSGSVPKPGQVPPPNIYGPGRIPGGTPLGQQWQTMQDEYAQQRAQQMGLAAPYGRYPDGTPVSPQNPNLRQMANQGRFGGGWGQ